MPAFPFEFEHSLLEGVKFHWLAQPLEITVQDGRAAAVRFLRTRLAGPDAGGRRQPEPVPGSEFEVPCDLVIPALGQARLAELWGQARGIRLEGGLIAVERGSGRTSNPRYYAGGDCVNGGREVVDAVADGKRAALAMKEAMETMADLSTVFMGIRFPQPLLAGLRAADQQRRADHAGLRRGLGRRGVEDHRGAGRQHRFALLLGGLERPAHDGPEQHRADLRPPGGGQPAGDRRGQEALPAATR